MEAPLKRKLEEEDSTLERQVLQKCDEEDTGPGADSVKIQLEVPDTNGEANDQRASEVSCLAFIL